MVITIYQHDDCLQHDPGPGHPENAGRLDSATAALQTSVHSSRFTYQQAPLGTREQVLLAHTPALWDLVTRMSPSSGRISLDPDTHMSPVSLAAALRAVGAACAAVETLATGQARHIFCLTRPPGHHATPQRAMGFCIFNQIAIAALHAQAQGLQRVAVVDFDVHHGNGTQDIFQDRANLLYISTHQFPHYPGTGSREENRAGNIHNIPLRNGTGHESYLQIFADEVLTEVSAFHPDVLLVSAGFDAHERDPLAGLALTEQTYRELGRQLQTLANRHCQGRLLSVLEGGYNLDVLGNSIVAYCEGTLEA